MMMTMTTMTTKAKIGETLRGWDSETGLYCELDWAALASSVQDRLFEALFRRSSHIQRAASRIAAIRTCSPFQKAHILYDPERLCLI